MRMATTALHDIRSGDVIELGAGDDAATALVLLVFIAIWAIVTGVLQIVGAIQLRKEIDNEWLLIVGGVLSVLFGLAVLVRPGAGALALIFVIGAFAIAYGIILVAFAFRLRRHSHAP